MEDSDDEDENMNLENYENLENPAEKKNKKISDNNEQEEEIVVKEEPGVKGKYKGLYLLYIYFACLSVCLYPPRLTPGKVYG